MSPAITGDRAVLLDATVVVLVSVALCLVRADLVWMDALVPLLMMGRMLLWSRLPANERDPLRVELTFFALCIGLGAFNDWNSVHRHRIYDYAAPLEDAELSLVPLWMLLFWGMILRFVVTLARWRRLGAWVVPHDRVVLPTGAFHSGAAYLGLQLGLVLVTRQVIYRAYLDPVWSWLVFALALLVYWIVLRPNGAARRLMLLALCFGPLVEVLYIQVAGLHRYHLGWLAGVPLWIALWWILAMPIWADLSLRLHRWLSVGLTRAPVPRLTRRRQAVR